MSVRHVLLTVVLAFAAVPASRATAPSREAALALGAKIEAGMARRDPNLLGDVLSWTDVCERAGEGLNPPAGLREEMAASGAGWSQSLFQAIGEQGSYRLLREEERAGARWLLFRQWGVAGLNYHEYRLTQKPDGSLIINDIYVLGSGELMSETLRPTILGVMAQGDRSFLDKILDKDADFVRAAPDLQAATAALNAGNGKAALAAIDRMPESVKGLKMVALLRFHAAGIVGGPALLSAAEDFARRFPGDPALDLLLIDVHATKGDIKAAHASIDKVGLAVDGDPMLQVLHAGVDINAGNVHAAKARFKRGTELDPGLTEAWWPLLGMALEEADHAETARVLTGLATGASIQFDDLRKYEQYSGFVASEEYAKWRMSR